MGTMTFEAEASTRPQAIVKRGGSLYVKVPSDWPEGAQALALLLPAAPGTRPPDQANPCQPEPTP